MTVTFDKLDIREFKFGIDIDGNEFVKLPTPITTALECWWCEKPIKGKEFWMSLCEAEPVCVKCVEGKE